MTLRSFITTEQHACASLGKSRCMVAATKWEPTVVSTPSLSTSLPPGSNS
jgi:hypothetical protein